MPSNKNIPWKKLTIVSALSGLIYNSWPLGYWLNPAASKQALASALEAVHQPYNWVFIGGDVLSSLLIIGVCWVLWRELSGNLDRRLLKFVLVNIVLFGVGTIIDTLLPEQCLPGAANCPTWQHSPLLLAHGLCSIGASVCLFLALVFIWRRQRSALLNILVSGYILFGFFSLLEALTPAEGNWSQHYYIALCGIWLAVIPYVIRRTFVEKPRKSLRP
jgi:hypothetical protein